MSQKILPYKIPKMMLTYPYNAFYFGIYEANNIDYTDIILNDFLELYYFKKSAIHKIDFRNSGMFELNRFSSIEFPETNDIVKAIKDHINNGYYAILMLNQKYFQNESVHTTWDYCHDWLIYGYDDSTMQFYCSSYIGSEYGEILRVIQLNYTEVEASVRKIIPKYLKSYPSYFRNHFTRINLNWQENETTKDMLYKKLKRMFFPKHSARDGYWHPVAGIYSLDKLLKKINNDNGKPIFIQNIRIIYEFRQNVLLCLLKMEAEQNTINKYKTIVKETYRTLLLSHKYNITRSTTTFNTVYKNLKTLNKFERNILKNLYKHKN